jgi:hypothetical protein
MEHQNTPGIPTTASGAVTATEAAGVHRSGIERQRPVEKGLPRILETLEALGRARQQGGGWRG